VKTKSREISFGRTALPCYNQAWLYVPVAAASLSDQGRCSVTIEAQSYDGVIHEFPDNVPPEVMDRVVKQYTLSKQQQPPSTFNDQIAPGMFPAKPPGMFDDIPVQPQSGMFDDIPITQPSIAQQQSQGGQPKVIGGKTYTPVTDPDTLAQLNRPLRPVTDPAVLAQLNAPSQAAPPMSTAITDIPGNVASTAAAGVRDIGSSFQHAPPAPGQGFWSYAAQGVPEALGNAGRFFRGVGEIASAPGQIINTPAQSLLAHGINAGDQALRSGAVALKGNDQGIPPAMGYPAAQSAADTALSTVMPRAAPGTGSSFLAPNSTAQLPMTVRPAPAPSTQDLFAAAQADYQAAANQGLQLHPHVADALATTIEQGARAQGYRPFTANAPFNAADELRGVSQPAPAPPPLGPNPTAQQYRQWQQATQQAGQPQPLTYADIESVRQSLRKVPYDPLQKGSGGGPNYAAAQDAIHALDNYTSNIPAADVLAGDPARVSDFSNNARGNWAAARRGEAADNLDWRSDLQAASTGSGANINNAKRAAVRGFLTNDSRTQGWTEPELDQAENLVRGGFGANALRAVGKVAPTGYFSAAMDAIPIITELATGHPIAAALSGAGFGAAYAAKKAADLITRNRMTGLGEMTRARSPLGQAAPPVASPSLTPVAAMIAGLSQKPPQSGGYAPQPSY
jgi:hypothetical protein